jgi:hypothetical protein
LTAAGVVTLRRRCFACPGCGAGGYLLDDRLGLDGYLSPQARRLVCLAGASWSFELAARRLEEFCGVRTSAETIRGACHQEAAGVAEWRASSEEAGAAFRAALGDVEFQTDAAKVNTTEGWRDMKIGLFARRPRGAAATPEEWGRRALPACTARVAFATIACSEEFGNAWPDWASRLAVEDFTALSVLGDGAEWIWNEAGKHFPGHEGLLDLFHGVEHVSDAAKALFGEGVTASDWTERGRMALLRDGWWGLCEHVGRSLQDEAVGSDAAKRGALDDLVGYFAKHTGRLGYYRRLRRGQPIGSGQVEGAAKHMVGRRMKQTGARWAVHRVNRMAELCATLYSDCWDAYWQYN